LRVGPHANGSVTGTAAQLGAVGAAEDDEPGGLVALDEGGVRRGSVAGVLQAWLPFVIGMPLRMRPTGPSAGTAPPERAVGQVGGRRHVAGVVEPADDDGVDRPSRRSMRSMAASTSSVG
jgi:hypothetical protein